MEAILLNMWKAAVARAFRENRVLRIHGYVDQKGTSWNFLVRILPPKTGYRELLRQSLEQLEARKDQPFRLEDWGLTAEVDAAQAGACLEELVESYRRRLSADPESSGERYKEALHDTGEGYFLSQEDEGDRICLLSMEVIERQLLSGGVANEGAWGKSRIKLALERHLPIGRFLGRLNLTEANVNSVTVE